jgi:hypothetical protein
LASQSLFFRGLHLLDSTISLPKIKMIYFATLINPLHLQAEKLACTDMMVKDLYIENSLLIASVDRLEKQCMFLSQHAPGSA